MNPWLMPFGFLAIGAALLALAWALLVEYRRAFFRDPLSIMSAEVLSAILRQGGPGYVAMVALVAGFLLLLAGVALLLMLTWIVVRSLFHIA